MNVRNARHTLSLRHTLLALTVFVAVLWAAVAWAEPHYPINETSNDLEHAWTLRAAGLLPYTQLTPGESEALQVASDALVEPPLILIRNADHGYDGCIEKLDATRALVGLEPVIVGHEMVLFDDAHAVRVFVNAGGVVQVVESGGPEVEPLHMYGLAGDGEFAAAEIARSALSVHDALAGTGYADMHAMVCGYGIGFADADGTHLIIRVGVDGTVSCPEW